MPRNRVTWNGAQISKRVDEAAQMVVNKTALQIEGQAKVNITKNGQVDTGFMRASVYSNLAGEGSTYQQSQGEASAANGDVEMGEEIQPNEDGAVVAVGALYAIFQEERQSFLYAALQEVRGSLNSRDVEEAGASLR